MDIGQWWAVQDSKKQRWMMIVGGLTSLLLIMYMVSGKKEREVPDTVSPVQVDILGDDQGAGDLRQFAAEIKTLKGERATDRRLMEQQSKRIQNLQNSLSAMTNIADNPEQLGALVDEINRLKEDMQDLQESGVRGSGSAFAPPPVLVLGGNEDDAKAKPNAQGQPDLSNPFSDVTNEDAGPIAKYDPLARIKGAIDEGASRKPSSKDGLGILRDSSFERPPPQIVIDEPEKRPPAAARSGGSRPGQTSRDEVGESIGGAPPSEIYIPSGSLFTGILLNGMDAATSSGSSREPYPATIRITSLAFLPNRYRTNVRECFVGVAGVGRMDSERVHMRTETMSCILSDGSVIDVGIDGYVTGEDGKVGLRGVVVERTGALLMRSALAGFASGLAQALEPQRVNSVRTGDQAGGVEFDAPETSEVLEIGVYKGAATAMENLADYYMERADQIFPIIEIDAMRRVTIHLTAGVSLKILNNAQHGTLANNEAQR